MACEQWLRRACRETSNGTAGTLGKRERRWAGRVWCSDYWATAAAGQRPSGDKAPHRIPTTGRRAAICAAPYSCRTRAGVFIQAHSNRLALKKPAPQPLYLEIIPIVDSCQPARQPRQPLRGPWRAGEVSRFGNHGFSDKVRGLRYCRNGCWIFEAFCGPKMKGQPRSVGRPSERKEGQTAGFPSLLAPRPPSRSKMPSLKLKHLLLSPRFRQACRIRTETFCNVLAQMQREGHVIKTPRGFQLAPSRVPVSLSRSI